MRTMILFSAMNLFCSGWLLASNVPLAPEIRYKEGIFSLLNPPVLNPFGRNAVTRRQEYKARWGIYFWEFGDGHYQLGEQMPKHKYYLAPSRAPRVYLTPFNATNLPEMIPYNPETPIRADGREFPYYDLRNKKVLIKTNSMEEVVPGHDIQVVVHYKAPSNGMPNTRGYLFFFYNNIGDLPDALEAFSFKESRLYYQEQDQTHRINQIVPALKESSRNEITALRNRFYGIRVFRIGENNPLKPDEERRLFLSVQSNPLLRNYRDKVRNLSFEAVWVPDMGTFDPNAQKSVYPLTVTAVHDPNRIKASPGKVYFHPKTIRVLTYTVDVINTETGRVEDMTIGLRLTPGLNLESVSIQEVDPAGRPCASWADVLDYCYTIDTMHLGNRDSLIFRFRNIGLLGNNDRRELRKARLVFSIQTGTRRIPKINVRATVIFHGSEPVETNTARTTMRLRGLFAQGGLSEGLQAEGFHPGKTFLGNATLGFHLQDAPLGTGLVKGMQFDLAPFGFIRQDTTEIRNNPDQYRDDYMLQEQGVRAVMADLKALAGFQVNGILRVRGGIGVTIPLWAEMTHQVRAIRLSREAPQRLFESSKSYPFGLLQQTEPQQMFNSKVDPRPAPGLSWNLGVELGQLNDFAIGLTYEQKVLRGLQPGTCVPLASWNAYVRFRILTLRAGH